MNWDELSRLRLFEDINLESIKGLLRACPIRQLQPGEVLISAVQPNDSLYLLLSGRLRVHLDSLDSEPIAVFAAGETVGELSVIDQQPTSAFVVADQYARVLVVAEDIFWAMIDTPPSSIARNLLVTLAERLRHSNVTISRSKRLQQAYKRQATTDELTGLHNRRWLEDRLNHATISRPFDARPLSLIVADVDHFKDYSDELGQVAADHALYAVAQTMMNNVQPDDQPVHCGEGKFAVVLHSTDIAAAKLLAERLREAVAEAVIVMSDQSVLPPVTISLGVVQIKPGQSGEELMASADATLTRAIANGRNCIAE